MQTQQETVEWYESDDLWEKWARIGFTEQVIANAAEEVEKMVHLLGLSPGDSILDLCCGIGRHSLEFAKRSFDVTGVDRNAAFLKRAEQRAAELGQTIRFVQADMRSFPELGPFDAAINYFTSFGYFDSLAKEQQVVQRVYDSLKPGGVALFDTMSKEYLAKVFQPHGWQEEGDLLLIEERKVVEHWRGVQNRWVFLENGQRSEYRLTVRLFSVDDFERMLTNCGFGEVHIYGDLSGTPYDHEVKRMVVIGRKPA